MARVTEHAATEIPATMKAWQYSKYGGGADDLVLSSDVAVPKPGPKQVLIRLQAAAVNPAEWKLQSGIMRPFAPSRLPCIPGVDVAGEVVALGSRVQGLACGDQVFGTLDEMAGGALAEFTVLPAERAIIRPASVPPEQACCLGIAGCTALQGLRDYCGVPLQGGKVKGKAGKPGNILIANSSGGVGHYAVQLAKLAGCHVTATCGHRNMGLVKSLGADAVLDYASPEGAALASPEGRKYDAILDSTTVLRWQHVEPVLAPGGKWVLVMPSLVLVPRLLGGFLVGAVLGLLSLLSLGLVKFPRKTLTSVMSLATAKDLTLLGNLASEGQLRTVIEAEYKFEDAPEAWRKSMSGHVTGKLVVRMDKK